MWSWRSRRSSGPNDTTHPRSFSQLGIVLFCTFYVSPFSLSLSRFLSLSLWFPISLSLSLSTYHMILHMDTSAHTFTHSHMHSPNHAFAHLYSHTFTHSHIQSSSHSYICTCTHSRIHTYTTDLPCLAYIGLILFSARILEGLLKRFPGYAMA